MEENVIKIEDIYFMPYIGPRDVEEIKLLLEKNVHPQITLSACHVNEKVPANATTFLVTQVITPSYEGHNLQVLSFQKIEVEKDEAKAIITLDYSELKFTIDQANDQFKELILTSLKRMP